MSNPFVRWAMLPRSAGLACLLAMTMLVVQAQAASITTTPPKAAYAPGESVTVS